jgi:hypothetical protein
VKAIRRTTSEARHLFCPRSALGVNRQQICDMSAS